jgi:hypothetical protein
VIVKAIGGQAMLKITLRARQTVALLTSFCLLAMSLAPSIAAAKCPCPGMAGTSDPTKFGIITEKTPSPELTIFYFATENVKTGKAKIIKGAAEFAIGTLNNCNNVMVSKAKFCEVGVIFTPPGDKTYEGELALVYESEATNCTDEAIVKLEGAGTS